MTGKSQKGKWKNHFCASREKSVFPVVWYSKQANSKKITQRRNSFPCLHKKKNSFTCLFRTYQWILTFWLLLCLDWLGLTWIDLLRLKSEMDEWWVQSRYFGSNSMYYFTVLKDFSIKGENHRWWFWKKIELLSWAKLGHPFILNPQLT